MSGQHFSSPVEYLFGDSDTAANRLRLLHDIFTESSRAFLSESVSSRPNLAVDIGCGPGHTTRLINTTLNPARIVGIDSSESLIAEARTCSDREQYLVHDATIVPFPAGPADVLYARFVVSHLQDPVDVLGAWTTQLVEGGLLLLDEVETISTSNEVFSEYLGILDSLMSHERRTLYIGPSLGRMQIPGSIRVQKNQVRTLRVRDQQAAAIFGLNMEAWRDHQYLIDTYGEALITRVADQLKAKSRDADAGSTIEWAMRQMVLERVRPGHEDVGNHRFSGSTQDHS